MKHRSYSATDIRHVDLTQLLSRQKGVKIVVGVDVSKEELLLVLRWHQGSGQSPQGPFERPWRMSNPVQVPELITLLRRLREGRELIVALEPTGAYGDPLRQALGDAGIPTHRVSPKASHDWAEVFDGVPSQHDGKDAAIVAELCALGKSSVWAYEQRDENHQRITMTVDWMDAQRKLKSIWCGRIEALLARHWPEAQRLLDCSSGTLLRALEHWGGPAPLAADPSAPQRITRWGGRMLKAEKARSLLDSAGRTIGVRQGVVDLQRMKRYAAQARAAGREVALCRRELGRLSADNPVIQSQSAAVGVATACVLWTAVGDPRDYHCAAAYRKAMGLNLAERSSGRYQGKLKISKRGSAMARHWLHLAALRSIRSHAPVKAWYQAKKRRDAGAGLAAVTAVTRRLAIALYAVAVNRQAFDPQRLFPAARHARRRKGGPAIATL